MRAFLKCRRGTTAVAFAIVGPVFLMLLVPTFGVGAKYIADLLVARALEAGVQQGGNVQDAMCENLVAISCDGLQVHTVATYPSPDGNIVVYRAEKSFSIPVIGETRIYSTAVRRQG